MNATDEIHPNERTNFEQCITLEAEVNQGGVCGEVGELLPRAKLELRGLAKEQRDLASDMPSQD